MILVSACLAGFRCRYDGEDASNEEIIEMVRKGKAIPLCPEQLGGLPTPRSPCKIDGEVTEIFTGGLRIVDDKGVDQTDKFMKGAEEVLKIATTYAIKEAILKGESPSCGRNGVTAHLLEKNNINVLWY